MNAINPRLAAQIAKTGIPLTADMVAPNAEVERLRRELDGLREHLAFLERSTLPDLQRRIEWQRGGKERWHERAKVAERERDALQKRLHDAAMVRTWRNEDGKKFVFVEDIAPALLGLEPKDGDQR